MTELKRELQLQTSRRGYWTAIGIVFASIGIAALMFWRLDSQIAAMPRVEARGEHVVALPAGDLVVFGELTTEAGAASMRCAAKDSSGAPLPLTSMGSTTISYDVGSYHGRSLFDLDVRASGPVTVTCETDSDVVLAFGNGIGKSIVIGVTLTLFTALSACFIFWRTFSRRRRQRRARETEAAPVSP